MVSSPDRRAMRRDRNRWMGIVAAVAIALLLAARLRWLPAHAPLNVNEGWNAGQAMRALGPGSLYPAPDALIANNYPPLSFGLAGLLGRVVGDAIVAGRILSLAAMAATGAAVCAIVARLSATRGWAIAAGLLFGGYAATLLRNYVAMNDPQWIGQVAMTWALVLLVPARAGDRIDPRRAAAAALLIVAGGLVKHNLVAVPAAATLWLWLVDRRALVAWIVAGAASAGAACLLLWAVWGPTVFIDVLAPARSYSLARMAAKGAPLIAAALPALLACRPLWTHRGEDPRRLLPLALLAIALPVGVVQRSGDGVDVNAFFEAVIALCIAVPVGCALRPVGTGRRWLAVAALPALCLAPVAAAGAVHEWRERDAAVERWRPFIAAIAAARGPVACDDQALCHWARRQSALDFFAVKQRLLKGPVPALDAALDRGAFAAIVMRAENPGWHENRLTPAIHARYRTIKAAGGVELLVPAR